MANDKCRSDVYEDAVGNDKMTFSTGNGQGAQVLRTVPQTLTAEEVEIVKKNLNISDLKNVYITAAGRLIVVDSKGNEYDAGDARGLPGPAPYVGKNGNWWVNDRDTGVSASGGYSTAELDEMFAAKLSLSGGTMTGMIDMPKGVSDTGIMNGENKKIFGYGVDGKFYTGDPEYPLALRGSGANPTYNTFDMLKVQTGTYKGTGKSGSSGKNKITFTFTPKIVIVYEKAQAFLVSPSHYMIALDGMESGFVMTASNAINLVDGYVNGFGMQYTWTTTSLTWWHPHDTSNGYAEEQLNKSGKTYYWIAIG